MIESVLQSPLISPRPTLGIRQPLGPTLCVIEPHEREVTITGVPDVSFRVSNVRTDEEAFSRVREVLSLFTV